jgi:Predicted integral membrane protein
VHTGDLARQLASYGWRHGVLALAATTASFLLLGLIEALALRCAASRVRISRRSAMATAFVANAFSQSIGLALLTGAAVRLRAYSRHRLDASAVARTSAFVTLTSTLGLVACTAVALLASGDSLRLAAVALPARPVGLVLLLVIAAYVTWSVVASRDFVGRGRWRLRRPTGRVAAAQLLLSSADWMLTGTVLFAVLPSAAGLGFGELLRVYLIAQTVGMLSHVPGGAGVFEAVILTLAARGQPAQQAAVVAALVSFRIVYYLLPLLCALIVAAATELRPRRLRHEMPWTDNEPMVMRRVG